VLRRLNRPSVLIGFPADPAGLVCIDLDFAAAGAMCVDYLYDQGCREVAFLGEPPEVYERGTGYAERTMTGFRAAADRHGIEASIRPCQPTAPAVRAAIKDLLARNPGLSGVVVHNEPAVAPMLEALRAEGRNVPGDLSVISIGQDDVAERATPPLTSIAIPAEEVGRQAVELVMDQLDGRPARPATLIAPSLVIRSSTRR
jgi:DNA-binding LacI/PurR family transcriptional regulator